jgi:hypothetical protein
MDLPYVDEVSDEICTRQEGDILQEELDDDRILGLTFLGFKHGPALVVIVIVTLPEDFLQAIETPCDWESGVFELSHDASSREVLIATFALALTLHFETGNVS